MKTDMDDITVSNVTFMYLQHSFLECAIFSDSVEARVRGSRKHVQNHCRAKILVEEKQALEHRPFLLPDVGELAIEVEDYAR